VNRDNENGLKYTKPRKRKQSKIQTLNRENKKDKVQRIHIENKNRYNKNSPRYRKLTEIGKTMPKIQDLKR
jgi:hypothetical protein